MAKSFAKSFYQSKQWKTVRDWYVSERTKMDGGLCECCHTEPGVEVHHIKPLTPENINDQDITLNPDNLMFLCKFCHFEKHKEMILSRMQWRRKQRVLTDGKYFDEMGMVQPMRVYIVYGPPFAGKMDYVRQHKDEQDLVVNLDMIKTMLGSSGDNLTRLSFDIRDLIYKLIEERDDKIDCKNVWIVSGLPNKDKRHQLAERLQAKTILITDEQNNIRQRIMDDETIPKKVESLILVDKWFEDYEPD